MSTSHSPSSTHRSASHEIRIAAPIAQCQLFFTPAGEELWVDGWTPVYLHPTDGRTVAGMIFTTGSGDEFTIWSLTDFDTVARYARYSRVTPASRCGFVEVACTADGDAATRVRVTYTMTALTAAGVRSLAAFDAEPFAEMIDGWRASIEAQLPSLLTARIR